VRRSPLSLTSPLNALDLDRTSRTYHQRGFHPRRQIRHRGQFRRCRRKSGRPPAAYVLLLMVAFPQISLEVENFRFHSMFAAKSTRGGKNIKGKKVTSLCPFPLPSTTGDRLLVTTNDSRMRLYHASDKIVEAKYAGHENTSSQIRATFSDDGKWIISGSEDRHVYSESHSELGSTLLGR
jgi:hypothetical protein